MTNKKIKLSLETENEKYSVEFDPDSNIYKYCRHFRELLQSQGFAETAITDVLGSWEYYLEREDPNFKEID